ncbi:MAG: hypothetical protein WB681_01765 [Candidatus Cybelea sp.]
MAWQRNLWLLLALLVALIAWRLTHWITHVDHGPRPVVTIVFDERPPYQYERFNGVTDLEHDRHRFAEAALTSQAHILFLVTPTMHSIAVGGVDPSSVSCGSLQDERGAPTAFLVGADKTAVPNPIPIENRRNEVFIPIPSLIHAALARAPDHRGGIVCKLSRPLAMAPTFTERAITVRADTGPGGAVLLDVSALEDVDDLRFSGGLQAPLGGDRTRILYAGDDIVSAEWVDVTAQERRDIVLVIIGALSAIAAATVIEAVRPVVERRTKAR